MRTRECIEDDVEQTSYRNGDKETTGVPVGQLCLEVLLDIRDLLAPIKKK